MTFSTALSGLNAAQTELATTANNIANSGTNGFKRSRVTFGDIIATSPMQNPARNVGSGTYVRAVAQQFKQGAIETSDSALDLAISGQGFFTVRAGQGDTEVSFTRNGAFGVDAQVPGKGVAGVAFHTDHMSQVGALGAHRRQMHGHRSVDDDHPGRTVLQTEIQGFGAEEDG